MALTKLPKNAIGTGAIDASKIEDGTLQAVEISGTISSDKIATGTIANAKLSNSTFTIRGISRALGDSFSLDVNVDWQSVIVADGSTATTGVAGKGYFINTTSAAHTFTLPISATRGDTIAIKDYAATFATNKLTIARNGHNIQGVANNSLIGTNRASLVLVYVDSTKGWLYAEEHNVADLGVPPQYVSATGGTVTTSGNFKIHSFTGDGCFVVSNAGFITPAGGSDKVDYLVVAGGGGGGNTTGAGGGAGGYRTTFPSPGCNAGSFPIAATTYPITVGSGGTGGTYPGCAIATPGSSSIFSTITSAGGGRASGGSPPGSSEAGGSGGGSTSGPQPNAPGAAGNTPPVSPPQGNPGGAAGAGGGTNSGGGGGGAGAAGTAATPTAAGAGGAGLSNSISGSSVARAGGGGGGYNAGSGAAGGTGGGGGGPGNPPGNGTSNTGGGGGAGGQPPFSGGSGGKGIVVIRYKFQ